MTIRHHTTNQALQSQIGGDHYKRMKIQPMEFSMVNGLDACQHTIIKYVCRHEFKNGLQDLEKAKHCIDLLIALKYPESLTKEETAMPSDEKPTRPPKPKKKAKK